MHRELGERPQSAGCPESGHGRFFGGLGAAMRRGYRRDLLSVAQRKLLTPDDFTNLDDLGAKITAFENRYNTAARPFDWRFDRDDLNRLLERIAAQPPTN